MSEQLELIQTKPAIAKMPQGPIVRSAEIDGKCRWTLRRAWGAGPPILWCGLNPSKADGAKDDPTMLREIGFSFRWGFGSLVKVNMWPFITSKPAELRRWMKSEKSNGFYSENIGRVRAEIEKIDVRVAAWGAGPKYEEVRDFLSCLCWDKSYDNVFKCLGTNEDGSPRHTLARGKRRVPDDAKLVDWKYEWEEGY